MPSALASLADTSPTFFIASVSHEQERDREHRLVTMNYVHTYEQRDAQTAVLDGDFLQSLDFVKPFDVENSAHVALGDIAAYLSIKCAAGGDVASYHQVQLTNLFL